MMRRLLIRSSLFLVLLLSTIYYLPFTTFAIVDPFSSPNNRFGIHIISPSPDESSPAANLVNSSGGDWGYVTVLVESDSRDQNKWQNFFNDLRRRHLIPILRLATQPDGGMWKLPYDGEEQAWADFLDNLVWPIKNRYVVIYNEPNHATEWGGSVDPGSYARVLDKTITALKNKNQDFFVLNAGFDASTPNQPPNFLDIGNYLTQMEEEVPGIFNKLDGWVSHSYPNPNFSGLPTDSGKGTIRSWAWELKKLAEFKVTKNLPVFITETGWKHAEGLNYNSTFPTAEVVGQNLQQAFAGAWNNFRIVAVTPFLLNYQEEPFDHFSFKKPAGETQKIKLLTNQVLGLSYPEYYPSYQVIAGMAKTAGRPLQENQAKLIKGEIYPVIVAGENYTIPLTFKNIGQSIWGEYGPVILKTTVAGEGINIPTIALPANQKIEPGQETTFNVPIKALGFGTFKIYLQLFINNMAFDQPPLEFTTQVEPPVSLLVKTSLAWKKDFTGKYLLSVISDILTTATEINLDSQGQSENLEVRYLLPEHIFRFTLQKPYYKPKTIETTVKSGINTLDFGQLEPDLFSALLKPTKLWKLLPFSN